MDNSFAAMRKKAVCEVFSASPKLMELRKTMFVLLTGFCALRVAFSVYEIVFIVLRDASLTGALPNICLALLGAFFAYAIYNGASTMSFLMVIGGVYSLLANFASERVIDHIKNAGDVSYNIYMFILGGLALIQIVLFVYVGLSKRFKPYFEACMKVNNVLSQR